jgi:hypothetical protein
MEVKQVFDPARSFRQPQWFEIHQAEIALTAGRTFGRADDLRRVLSGAHKYILDNYENSL